MSQSGKWERMESRKNRESEQDMGTIKAIRYEGPRHKANMKKGEEDRGQCRDDDGTWTKKNLS